MIKIDNTLLQQIGLDGLPNNEKDSLLKHIYETLEMRVGMRLADQMTNQQLDEFEQYFEAKDDAGAFKWLESNFPNYKDVVQEEFDKLRGEVQAAAPQIMSAVRAPQHEPGAFGPKMNTPAIPAVQPGQPPLGQQPPMPPLDQLSQPMPVQPVAPAWQAGPVPGMPPAPQFGTPPAQTFDDQSATYQMQMDNNEPADPNLPGQSPFVTAPEPPLSMVSPLPPVVPSVPPVAPAMPNPVVTPNPFPPAPVAPLPPAPFPPAPAGPIGPAGPMGPLPTDPFSATPTQPPQPWPGSAGAPSQQPPAGPGTGF